MTQIFLKIMWTIMILTCLTDCTYNVSLVHTQGVADDVGDETASAAPTITVPVNPGSLL